MSVTSEMLSSLVFVALAAINMIVMLERDNPSRKTNNERPFDGYSQIGRLPVRESVLHHRLQHE
jgi:hypothetical protein